MNRLDDVLSHNIEGFLYYDLATMAADDPHGGGVAYPILTSTCAGIEFLGALLSKMPFRSFGRSASYFGAYWREYLYPPPSDRAELGKAIYKLVRNGLAHSFAMKGRIGTLRKKSELHLVRDPKGVLVIDAVQLARDFMESYHSRIKPLLTIDGDVRASMQQRLSEMESVYEAEAEKQIHAFQAVPMIPGLQTVAAVPAAPLFPLLP